MDRGRHSLLALLLTCLRRAIALPSRAILTIISLLGHLIARISSSHRETCDRHLLPPPSPASKGGSTCAHQPHWNSHALCQEYLTWSSSSSSVVVKACSRVPEPTITPPPLARHHSRHGDRETEGIIGYAIQELSPSPASPSPASPSPASTSRTPCGAHSVVESIPTDAVHHNNSITEPSSAYYPDHRAIEIRNPTKMHTHPPFIVDDDETAGLQNIAQKELVCITAQNIERYDMGIRIEKGAGFSVIPALKRQFTHEIPLHPSWTRHVHPDGQPYYYNTSRAGPRLRYVTLADLLTTSVLTEIELFVDHLHDLINRPICLSSFTPSGPGNGNGPGDGDDAAGDGRPAAATGKEEVEVEVFLQLSADGTWGYYIVDHPNRCLFWLEDIDVEMGIWEIGGKVMTFAHMQHYITYEYWCHCEWFPHDKTITREELDELAAFLAYGIIDTMTSMDSTISYSSEDLTTMLQVVNQMQDLNEKTVPVNVAAARMISFFANERLLNFHGIHGARLTSEQSVQGHGSGDRSLLITVLSPLLFCAPDTHLKGLEKMWVDGIIKQIHWKRFIETLKNDWTDHILYGTVLLSVNVAFLSIQSVNEAAQIASLLSAACSIGSIIFGLLLVRQHRNMSKETAKIAAGYLSSRTHPKFALETLAIIYSLPYALVMWAIVPFLAAMAFISFHERDVFQSIVISATWLFIGVLIVWTIYTHWQYRPSRLRQLLRDGVRDLKRLLGAYGDEVYPDNHLPLSPSLRRLPLSPPFDNGRRSSIFERAWRRIEGKGDKVGKGIGEVLKPFFIIARVRRPRMDCEMTVVGENA